MSSFPDANEFHIFTSNAATTEAETLSSTEQLPLLLLNYYEQMTEALESSIYTETTSRSSHSSIPSCENTLVEEEHVSIEDMYESIVKDLIATAELGFHIIAREQTIELDKIEAQRACEFKGLIRSQFPRILLSFQEAFESGIERPDWLCVYHIRGGEAFPNTTASGPKEYNPNALPQKRVHPAAERVAFQLAHPQLIEYEVDTSYQIESREVWRRINDSSVFYHFVMGMFRMKYGAKTHRFVSWIKYSDIAELVEDSIIGACEIWNEEQDAYTQLMKEEDDARKVSLIGEPTKTDLSLLAEEEEENLFQARFFSYVRDDEPVAGYHTYKPSYIPFFQRQTPIGIISVMFAVSQRAQTY